MNDQEYNRLRELSWRRRLTHAEEAAVHEYLSANPQSRDDWQVEAELNLLLEQLPEAPPVASNFTARVLQAVQLEDAARERTPARASWISWRFLHGWLPKAAVAGVALAVFSIGYHQHQVNARAAFARNVLELSDAVSASDPELMGDFEPIRRLSEPQPKADLELIALMK
jgi:hypothetical protein